MIEEKNGGPAFPMTEYNGDGSYYHDHSGMTLRDYFAAQALPAIIAAVCARQHHLRDGMGVRQSMAMDAYELADEMLKARDHAQYGPHHDHATILE